MCIGAHSGLLLHKAAALLELARVCSSARTQDIEGLMATMKPGRSPLWTLVYSTAEVEKRHANEAAKANNEAHVHRIL